MITDRRSHTRFKRQSSVARAQDSISWILGSAQSHCSDSLGDLSCSEAPIRTPAPGAPSGKTQLLYSRVPRAETLCASQAGTPFPLILAPSAAASLSPWNRSSVRRAQPSSPHQQPPASGLKRPSQHAREERRHGCTGERERGRARPLRASCVESECASPVKRH